MNPYSFDHSVPHYYVLSEKEKHALLDVLQDEFGVDISVDSKNNLTAECHANYEQFIRIVDDDLYDDSLMLKLIESLNDLRHYMNGDRNITLKRKRHVVRQRWHYLWNKRYPLATFKEICVHELGIDHFDGSSVDYACRKLHKKKMSNHSDDLL
jgi:NADH dehydrogenase/NADH:ubiquinone oxidoreductase subunit G